MQSSMPTPLSIALEKESINITDHAASAAATSCAATGGHASVLERLPTQRSSSWTTCGCQLTSMLALVPTTMTTMYAQLLAPWLCCGRVITKITSLTPEIKHAAKHALTSSAHKPSSMPASVTSHLISPIAILVKSNNSSHLRHWSKEAKILLVLECVWRPKTVTNICVVAFEPTVHLQSM